MLRCARNVWAMRMYDARVHIEVVPVVVRLLLTIAEFGVEYISRQCVAEHKAKESDLSLKETLYLCSLWWNILLIKRKGSISICILDI